MMGGSVNHMRRLAVDISANATELYSEIARLRAEREWRSIETAPPEITKGLVLYPQFYCVSSAICIVYKHDEGPAIGLMLATLDLENMRWINTHWQPLLAPPEGGK